jgi:hypothetical protein
MLPWDMTVVHYHECKIQNSVAEFHLLGRGELRWGSQQTVNAGLFMGCSAVLASFP